MNSFTKNFYLNMIEMMWTQFDHKKEMYSEFPYMTIC